MRFLPSADQHSLERLEWMTAQSKPFYLEIAPASPHVQPGGFPTVPCARHLFDFPDAKAPRVPNYNPSDEYQSQKPAWIRDLPAMNETIVNAADASMRARMQGLQGVDELVGDVVDLLEHAGLLSETYSQYLRPSVWKARTNTR